jgi:hypothetical protein
MFVSNIMYKGVTLELGVVLGVDRYLCLESNMLYPRTSYIIRGHHML